MRLTLRIANSPSTGVAVARARRRAASISSQSSASGERRVLRARAAERRRRRARPASRSSVREVDPARLPVLDRVVGLEQVDAADQVLEPRDRRAAP